MNLDDIYQGWQTRPKIAAFPFLGCRSSQWSANVAGEEGTIEVSPMLGVIGVGSTFQKWCRCEPAQCQTPLLLDSCWLFHGVYYSTWYVGDDGYTVVRIPIATCYEEFTRACFQHYSNACFRRFHQLPSWSSCWADHDFLVGDYTTCRLHTGSNPYTVIIKFMFVRVLQHGILSKRSDLQLGIVWNEKYGVCGACLLSTIILLKQNDDSPWFND